jgi:hypothetical protein
LQAHGLKPNDDLKDPKMRKLALATATVFCLLVSLAAAEQTRETYKAQVEPICKQNTLATERIMKGAKREIKQGKLKLAGSKFLRAGASLKRAYNQLVGVEKPPADAARLTSWLGYLKTEAGLFTTTGKALKAGNRHKAQKLINRLTKNADTANSKVLAFNFHWCRVETSKYT